MSAAVGFSIPCFVFAFFIWRVADQSFSSLFPLLLDEGNYLGIMISSGDFLVGKLTVGLYSHCGQQKNIDELHRGQWVSIAANILRIRALLVRSSAHVLTILYKASRGIGN